MINIYRHTDEPKELTRQRNLKSGTYDTPETRLALAEIFHSKCYICEKGDGNFNIEHMVSHQRNQVLRMQWENLFYCCQNCNKIKSTRFDDILDCCDYQTIITEEINHHLDNTDLEHVKAEITPLKQQPSASVLKTIELLQLCCTGTTFDSINVANETIRQIENELNRLKGLIIDYFHYKRSNQNNKVETLLGDMNREFDLGKPYLAFKIAFIKSNDKYFKMFGTMLPKFDSESK